ncbi:hypothetical protein STRAU_5353 [Streptomyces aurantiacus JA 4570]|uniref:Uncharacterized protein n=1 Tax=Streptomyces aurantiacus JA 4570 TaxID=1286094 RepID=S3ZG45_9ACTN|nr:hypothetical protein STRAU_5353 [Streptomyces aurantiacus JA 4570]
MCHQLFCVCPIATVTESQRAAHSVHRVNKIWAL